ncbi:hypothetical protein FJ250_06980, partial [bacterium]|nr:hypothetical protein [bacterium]
QHYQWQGETPALVNAKGRRLGKLNTMNDFCTNPLASWIGNAANSDGKVIAQGCSKCHAGLGLRPEPTLSRAQLENIDCLICHASGYRRDLYQDDAGTWAWKPILWRNQPGLDSVAKRISMPKRAMCLRCHAGAGGGPNFKRGDLEYELADCSPEFDVHMASGGNNLECVDCHRGKDHRVRGRGSDLSGTDSPDDPLDCETCHDARPHGVAILDRHTDRVNCTVCHIPTFAKKDPTDMVRDWSTPYRHEAANKWSATITMGQDVTPVYAWFNGKSRVTLMGESVQPGPDGAVTLMRPEGSRQDKSAKIHAFKLHQAKLPLLEDRGWLVPLAVDEFFIDGDLHKAVVEGAEAAYGVHDAAYRWAPVQRYMGIFHEVQPAERALECLDCHREGGRLDWRALGYKGDPMLEAIR